MNSKETLQYIDGYIQEILADDTYDMHLRTYKCFNRIKEMIKEVDIPDAREVNVPLEEIEPPKPWLNPPEEKEVEPWQEFPEDKNPPIPLPDVVISCDASITKNPGGDAAIAFVVRRRNMKPYDQYRLMPKANTINEAEYDAIYHAMEHVRDWPGKFGGFNVHIVSDSQLAIYQLKGQWEVNEPRLARKKKFILELIDKLPNDTRHKETKITMEWKPRNSTSDLKLANNIAQSCLGVENH